MIHTTGDFFNTVIADIRKKYFPNENHGYTNNLKYHAATYAVDLFSNGALNYRVFIGRLAKACDDTTLNIHTIISKYVTSFGSYEYKPSKKSESQLTQ